MGSEYEWIQTYTGRKFYPLAPRAEDVCIEDIAHALSLKCRFTGHCREFYSVAEHSVRVSRIVCPEHALAALMHDAAEAYLPDVASPIKRRLAVEWGLSRPSSFASAEAEVMKAIARVFGFSSYEYDDVVQADLILLATEARDLMSKPPEPWGRCVPMLEEKIRPWTPDRAKLEFMTRFNQLTGKQPADAADTGEAPVPQLTTGN